MNKEAVKNIPESKLKTVKELKELIGKSKTILIASIKNIPGSQFQEIGKKLRGKALIKIPKKNLVKRAFEEAGKEEIKELENHLEEGFALLFSDLDSYDLAGELLKNRTPAKAKPGQIALEDIEVSAGPTDLVPGPAISELGALGIQIQIQGGKIEIKAPKIIAHGGKPISQGAANIMSKLDIKPFSIGFKPLCAYDSNENKIYLNIQIDREETLSELISSSGKAISFAMELGYITEETLKLMISRAGSHEKRLIKIISGEPDEEIIEEIKENTPKKETKEEEKVDTMAGLASMFG